MTSVRSRAQRWSACGMNINEPETESGLRATRNRLGRKYGPSSQGPFLRTSTLSARWQAEERSTAEGGSQPSGVERGRETWCYEGREQSSPKPAGDVLLQSPLFIGRD